MIDKVCKNCDYFEPYKEYIAENCGFIGLCHRYPDYRNVANGHWCGEWKLRRGRIRMTKEELIEKQIPKKPYIDNDNGVYEKEYCPACYRSLFPNDSHCKCGQAIDWSESE